MVMCGRRYDEVVCGGTPINNNNGVVVVAAVNFLLLLTSSLSSYLCMYVCTHLFFIYHCCSVLNLLFLFSSAASLAFSLFMYKVCSSVSVLTLFLSPRFHLIHFYSFPKKTD